MVKVQDCRQGCGAKVTVQLDEASGKYKPYDINKIDPETGEYLLHDCPKSPYNLNKGKFYSNKPQSSAAAPAQRTMSTTTTTQGGQTLDMKRTRVIGQENTQAINELRQEFKALREFLEHKIILDGNRYEGQMNQMYNVMAPFLSTQGVVASELAKDRQDILDTSMINHAKRADENIAAKSKTKFVDESKQEVERDLDERIPDNHDELLGAVIDDDNNENVIAED